MKSITSYLRRAAAQLRVRSARAWAWYRGRKPWQQAVIALVLLAIIVGGIVWAKSGGAVDETAQARTVELQSVSALSGNGSGTSIVGTVRSVTEADILAQAGGTVESVHTSLGASVPAGFVIAELDNQSQAASVLQAEGAYDAAIASRNAQSLPDTRSSAAEAYQSAYTSVDTVIQNDIDQFFGSPTATGPSLLIRGGSNYDLSRKRKDLNPMMDAWSAHLSSAYSADPAGLLDEATSDTQTVSSFLIELAAAANDNDSRATADQLAGLAAARSSIDATVAKAYGGALEPAQRQRIRHGERRRFSQERARHPARRPGQLREDARPRDHRRHRELPSYKDRPVRERARACCHRRAERRARDRRVRP